MQVTLQPIDWDSLSRFASAEAFIEWMYDSDGDVLPDGYDPEQSGWTSDSATQYFEVAEALEHLQGHVGEAVAENLSQGLRRIVCQNGHVDDFGTGPASDNHHWLSASPESTRDIWDRARRTDLDELCQVLRKNPPQFGNVHEEIETVFVPVIKQHLAMLELAAANGYGLMGHCG